MVMKKTNTNLDRTGPRKACSCGISKSLIDRNNCAPSAHDETLTNTMPAIQIETITLKNTVSKQVHNFRRDRELAMMD